METKKTIALNRGKLFLPFLLTTLLFVSLLVLGAPIMDSDDNFYILYTLAGGYGNHPSHLLHYYYEWHPLLFWPLARLFHHFPHFNWYTGFLLLLHWISCINLLYGFLSLMKRPQALFLFLLFFLFFESRFLLSLNDSSTSFILAISGCSSLLFYFLDKTPGSRIDGRALVLPALLILTGGLLRVHTTGLYVVLSLGMGLFILPFYQYRKMAGILLLTVLILGAFVAGHIYFYEWKIPGSKKEEKFRQSIFYLANHPVKNDIEDTGLTQVKNSFIQSSFLYDTSFMKDRDLEHFKKRNSVSITERNYKQTLFWTFINARVYILLVVNLLLALLVSGTRKMICRWLIMCLPAWLIYIYLSLFMKVTEGIFITLLCSVFLSAVFCFRTTTLKRTPLMLFVLFLLVMNSAWMMVRLHKISAHYTQKIELTRAQLKEIGAHRDLLFVNTDKELRTRAFYIWDTPSEYPLVNLIHKELLITNSYQPTLERFGIRNLMEELPVRNDIVLFSRIDPLIKEYYWLYRGTKTEILPLHGFKTLKAHQVKMYEND